MALLSAMSCKYSTRALLTIWARVVLKSLAALESARSMSLVMRTAAGSALRAVAVVMVLALLGLLHAEDSTPNGKARKLDLARLQRTGCGLFRHAGQQSLRGEATALQQPYPDKSLRAMQADLAIRQAGIQSQPLPLRQAFDLLGIQLQPGHVGHQAFQRQHAGGTLLVTHRCELRPVVSVVQIEMGNRGAAQADQMRTTAECRADVFGECAYVSALAATHGDIHFVAGKRIQKQLVYHHTAQFALYGFAFADVFVERLAQMFERAVHGRELLDLAAKFCQYRINIGLPDLDRMFGGDLAFGIAGGGGLSQAQQGTIGFIGIQQSHGKFGCLAETDRQQAGGEGIECAGVPGFFSLKQSADFLQCSVRT